MNEATVDDYLMYIPVGVAKQRLFVSTTRTTMPANPRGLDDVEVSVWESFADTVDRERKAALNWKSEQTLPPVIEQNRRAKRCGNEAEVEYLLGVTLFEPLNRLMDFLGVAGSFRPRPREVILDPDFSWSSEMVKESTSMIEAPSSPQTATESGESSVDKLLIEVKKFWAFDAPDDLVPILLLEKTSPMSHTKQSDETGPKVVRAVSQIYGYMSFNHLKYGVLATYEKFFFLRRSSGDAGSSRLEITRVIRRDQTRVTDGFTLMEAWLSLLIVAEEDHLFTSPYPSPVSKQAKLKLVIKTQMELLETAKIGNLYFSGRITRGQLGAVVHGGIWGQRKNSVMKIVDMSKSSMKSEKLDLEMSVYRQLENLQGRIVPQVFGFLLISRWIKVIVLSNCGEKITRDKFVAYHDDIQAMVKEIHDAGVAHGDLAYRNILVDTKGKLTIVDFSDAKLRSMSNEEEFSGHCKQDLDVLKCLLDRQRE